jgi:microcystin-dependent protein
MTRQNPIWIQTSGGVPTYPARLDRMLAYQTFTEGVLSGFLVSQRALGANMTLDISAGYAVIYGDDQANQHAYVINDDAADLSAVTIAAAPGSQSRIDLVYVRINDPNAGGPAGNNFTFGVVTGTAAASPTVPALPTSAIPLATVLIAVGNSSVIDSMITDTRPAARVKGSSPYGSVQDFFGREADVPADFIVPFGQAVSRTQYFGLCALARAVSFAAPWGPGNGTTTFNVPDMRGVVAAGLDNMGGTDAGRLSSANTLGIVVGTETFTLLITNLPSHSHTGVTSAVNLDHSHTGSGTTSGHNVDHVHFYSGTTGGRNAAHVHSPDSGGSFVMNGAGSGGSAGIGTGTGYSLGGMTTESADHAHGYSGNTAGSNTDHSHTYSFTTSGMNVNTVHQHTIPPEGSNTPHSSMQPTIMVNKIIRAMHI